MIDVDPEHAEYRLTIARELAEKLTAAAFGKPSDEKELAELADLAAKLQLEPSYSDRLGKLIVTLREQRRSKAEVAEEVRKTLEREARRKRDAT